MNEIAKRVVYLVNKFLKEELSDQEKTELESWITQSDANRQFFEKLTNSEYLFKAVNESDSEERSLQRILSKIETEKGAGAKVVGLQWFRWSAAAAIVLLVAGAVYFLTNNRKQEPVAKVETQTEVLDKAPGRDGAILKLADGREIVLDDAGNGNLAQQGSTAITKEGNLLAYNSKGKSSGEVLYNTLHTPVGRQFQIVLPDGTKAWLNSYSSITYPTAFTGKERNVTVTGEVYMEVAKNPAKPFKAHVKSPVGGMEETIVEVLGTHFNINGYGDEMPVKTTLLEGKVKVTEGSSLALLKPGQQAQVESNKISVRTGVDLDKETAWKNGLFNFSNDKLKNIMPQISRWYDVDVVYENKDVENIIITGEIERKANLSEVLKILSYLKIDYKIEGRKLILKG